MKYNWRVGTYNKNIDNLGMQLEKLMRMNNENKYSTRKRYMKAQERFIIYLGSKFKLQNLKNISDKHLEAYGRLLIDKRRSKCYIKTELSAIRAMHGLVPGKMHELMLPDAFNAILFQDYCEPGNRVWKDNEMLAFIDYAIGVNRHEYARILKIMRLLRIPLGQVFSLKTIDVEYGVISKVLLIETESVGIEVIKLSRDQVIGLNELLQEASNYYFYSFKKGENIKDFKRKFSGFIYDHSDQFSDSEGSIKERCLAMKGLMERK